MDDFGQRLRRVREEMKLSQVGVARVATADDEASNPESFANQMSRWENGRELNPSLDALEKIARGLGITLSEFFSRIETQSAESAPRPERPLLPTAAAVSNDEALADAQELTQAQWQVIEAVIDAFKRRDNLDRGTDHRKSGAIEKPTSERLESGRTDHRQPLRRPPPRRPGRKGRDKR